MYIAIVSNHSIFVMKYFYMYITVIYVRSNDDIGFVLVHAHSSLDSPYESSIQ